MEAMKGGGTPVSRNAKVFRSGARVNATFYRGIVALFTEFAMFTT